MAEYFSPYSMSGEVCRNFVLILIGIALGLKNAASTRHSQEHLQGSRSVGVPNLSSS